MKEYKCKSKMLPIGPCPHNCKVKTEFEPIGCLKYAVYEEWEEIKEDNVFKREECIYVYCPTPELCKKECVFCRMLNMKNETKYFFKNGVALKKQKTRMKQTITIIIGLPASGKTTLIEQSYSDRIVFDDYHKYDNKSFESSIYYSDFVKTITNGNNAVMSDISYCKEERLNEIEQKIKELKNDIEIVKIYFDNKPELCKKNVLCRNRETAKKEIDFIDRISPHYKIPQNIMPLEIKTK